MTTKRKRKKTWVYHEIKTKPGNIIKASRYAEAGDLCLPWPSIHATTYNHDAYDGNYEYLDHYIRSKPYNKPSPCLHIKNTMTSYPAPSYQYQSVATHLCSDGSYKSTCGIVACNNFTGFALIGDGYRLPDIPDLNQAHREALEFFASGCQPIEANWAVNMFEFSEMINLAMKAAKAAQLFMKLAAGVMPYSWGMFLRKFARLSSVDKVTYLLNKGSKELADAYLEFNFAIAPLLSDVKAVRDELNALSSRIAFFKKNSKKPVHVRFKKDLSSAFSIQPTSYPPLRNITYSDYATNIFRVAYKATYTASAMATYDVSGLKDGDIAYRLAKRAFGFSDPLVFLWEITRFSFIIDWFVDVGGYLASLPSSPTFPYVLSEPVHSIHIEQTNSYLYHYYVGTLLTPRIVHQQVVHTDLIEYYKRTLGLPLNFSGIDTSLPGFKQLMLALSLGRSFFK